MVVNHFKVGDKINLYGFVGTVAEVSHKMCDQTPCTYLRVQFDDPKTVGYQYENAWYGGSDDIVAYGYVER